MECHQSPKRQRPRLLFVTARNLLLRADATSRSIALRLFTAHSEINKNQLEEYIQLQHTVQHAFELNEFASGQKVVFNNIKTDHI